MINDNYNIWFYTLSTIAQTCAAIIALGGAFVVFKLDKVQTGLQNYRGRVVDIVLVWRKGTKQADKFFDESNQDILDQYKIIVRDNNEKALFTGNNIDRILYKYEGLRKITIGLHDRVDAKSELYDIQLTFDERKRWCERMADLLEKNIKIEKNIFAHLKQALIFLTSSIFLSIFLLLNVRTEIVENFSLLLLFTVVIALMSIIYSAYAVWDIATSKPIL